MERLISVRQLRREICIILWCEAASWVTNEPVNRDGRFGVQQTIGIGKCQLDTRSRSQLAPAVPSPDRIRRVITVKRRDRPSLHHLFVERTREPKTRRFIVTFIKRRLASLADSDVKDFAHRWYTYIHTISRSYIEFSLIFLLKRTCTKSATLSDSAATIRSSSSRTLTSQPEQICVNPMTLRLCFARGKNLVNDGKRFGKPKALTS